MSFGLWVKRSRLQGYNSLNAFIEGCGYWVVGYGCLSEPGFTGFKDGQDDGESERIGVTNPSHNTSASHNTNLSHEAY